MTELKPEDVPAGAPETLAQRLEKAAAREVELSRKIDAREAELTKLKAERNDLRKKEIPTIMGDMGQSLAGVPGFEIKVETKVSGTLAKSKDPDKAVAFLRSAGGDIPITTELTVPLPLGDNRGPAVAALLQETMGLNAHIAQTVNPSKLAAFARARLKSGEPIDMKLLGLSQWQEAKVKEN